MSNAITLFAESIKKMMYSREYQKSVLQFFEHNKIVDVDQYLGNTTEKIQQDVEDYVKTISRCYSYHTADKFITNGLIKFFKVNGHELNADRIKAVIQPMAQIERRSYTPAEIEKMRDVIKSRKRNQARDLLLLSFFTETKLPLAEIAELKFSNLSKTQDGYVVKSKNNYITLSAEQTELLENYLQVRKDDDDLFVIEARKNGGYYMPEYSIRQIIYRLRRAAGITEKVTIKTDKFEFVKENQFVVPTLAFPRP